MVLKYCRGTGQSRTSFRSLRRTHDRLAQYPVRDGSFRGRFLNNRSRGQRGRLRRSAASSARSPEATVAFLTIPTMPPLFQDQVAPAVDTMVRLVFVHQFIIAERVKPVVLNRSSFANGCTHDTMRVRLVGSRSSLDVVQPHRTVFEDIWLSYGLTGHGAVE